MAVAACCFAGCQKSTPGTSAPAPDEPRAAADVSAEKPKAGGVPRPARAPEPAAAKKLDAQLLLALKQSRAEPPFDNPNTPPPEIPVRTADGVLVDLNCAASEDLLKRIAALGGRVADRPRSAQLLRIMIPLDQLEALASHADVRSIVPAELTVNSKAATAPSPEPLTSKP